MSSSPAWTIALCVALTPLQLVVTDAVRADDRCATANIKIDQLHGHVNIQQCGSEFSLPAPNMDSKRLKYLIRQTLKLYGRAQLETLLNLLRSLESQTSAVTVEQRRILNGMSQHHAIQNEKLDLLLQLAVRETRESHSAGQKAASPTFLTMPTIIGLTIGTVCMLTGVVLGEMASTAKDDFSKHPNSEDLNEFRDLQPLPDPFFYSGLALLALAGGWEVGARVAH
jgi:hypothetical protein